MPELPDVENFRRYMEQSALNQRVTEVHISDARILEDISAEHLQEKMAGNQFVTTRRHGKYLLAGMRSGGWVVFHFGMTGFFVYGASGDAYPRHARAVFTFENNDFLAFDCQRLLGRLTWTESAEDYIASQKLGPDALELDFKSFADKFAGARTVVKSALMNQERVAGIGNIYSDEILFQARIHPKTPISRLDEGRLKHLYQTMRDVLNTAMDCGAAPEKFPAHFLLPHRAEGKACPVCGSRIQKIKISGRTAYMCENCQV
ncbi:MAG: Fpg/Nei family DNA glycosylase [Desulfobacterales bacterium]